HHLLKEKSGRSPAENFSPYYTSSRAGATPVIGDDPVTVILLSLLYLNY
ncbi:MAG: hypothetical protein RLZZ29_844, partial [Cyanobacteriota bacterium]